MSRCVIVGGADIKRYDIIKSYFLENDYYIFCDCGLKHKDIFGVDANLIVGDFDSYDKPDVGVETIVLPTVKDDTDTVYAVKEGLKRGYKEFLLVGCIGERIDHTLGNISILQMLDNNGARGVLVDDYSEMELVKNEIKRVPDSFSYFSLINIYGSAKGISIKNAKYPLDNAEITTDYQYGISNEVVKGSDAMISVNEGALLLVKVY
ncbi:MAG: thiamine diphosphokinase [Lachnospiraceae bacterium]|nr:thiamine diphosphokinase [Lachnospiraceae bacterium]